MFRTSVNAHTRVIIDTYYITGLHVKLPGYDITAELINLDESTTNVTYAVCVMRLDGETPEVVRTWSLLGGYMPHMGKGADEFFAHRNNYNATNFMLGSKNEAKVVSNLIAAIFDGLLGSCDTSDTDKITEYAEAAFAMHQAQLVDAVGNQYKAGIFTPSVNITGFRNWNLDADCFRFIGTTWMYRADLFNRMTHQDHALGTTYEKVLEIFKRNAVTASEKLGSMQA